MYFSKSSVHSLYQLYQAI